MPPTIALLVACAPTEPPGPSGAVRAELRRESASFRSPWPGAGEVTLALRGGGDSAVEAWDPLGRGFDHSFRVAEPPTDGRPVVLEVTVDGDVVVDGDGRSATVRKSGTVLRYQGLAAWDEAGTPLPARLEATATGLRIVVQTLGAVGAITIDPLLYGTGWEVVGAPDNVDFGSSVAAADVDGDGFDDVIVADELHGAVSGGWCCTGGRRRAPPSPRRGRWPRRSRSGSPPRWPPPGT